MAKGKSNTLCSRNSGRNHKDKLGQSSIIEKIPIHVARSMYNRETEGQGKCKGEQIHRLKEEQERKISLQMPGNSKESS